MVLPDSHGVARAPWYSGACPQSRFSFAYGGVTLFAAPFQVLLLLLRFLTLRWVCNPSRQVLQPPSSNACRLALEGFGLVPVRSPLLRESRLISSPPGTEMVQFPGFAHCSPAFPGLGFPIRKSPRHRSLASSTGLIAGSYVLHRLLVPRHPPYALIHLTQFSRYLLARYALLAPELPPVAADVLACHHYDSNVKERQVQAPVTERLVANLRIHRSGVTARGVWFPSLHVLLAEASVRRSAPSWQSSRGRSAGFSGKEVIQPQVPLRLPCYDFTPIIEQTVGACLPCGSAQRLRVHPTFVV